MTHVLTIAGSPSAPSRSAWAAAYTGWLLEGQGLAVDHLVVRDLPASDLLHARFDSPAIRDGIERVRAASAIVITTPIYKASFAGTLKAFLDLLPQASFAGKLVLPIATGGSTSHLLALDYALNPVLAALGAQHIIRGVYIHDAQLQTTENGYQPDQEIDHRLRQSAGAISAALGVHQPHHVLQGALV